MSEHPSVLVFIKLDPDFDQDDYDEQGYDETWYEGNSNHNDYVFIEDGFPQDDRESQYRIIQEVATGNYWMLTRYFISWEQAEDWEESENIVQVTKKEITIEVWKPVSEEPLDSYADVNDDDSWDSWGE